MSMANEEYTFVFRKAKHFWRCVNKQFDLENMNDVFGDDNTDEGGDYTFILCENVPSNMEDCIDNTTGCLIRDTQGLSIIDLQEVYSNISADLQVPNFKLKCNPIQDWDGGFTINLDGGATDIQIQLGDSQMTYLEGIFLVKRETKNGDLDFVMAYSRIASPINVRDFINVPFDGLVMGVGYCAYGGN